MDDNQGMKTLLHKAAAGACQVLILVAAYLIVGPYRAGAGGHVAGAESGLELLVWLGKLIGVVLLLSLAVGVAYWVGRKWLAARSRRALAPDKPDFKH